MHRDKKVTRCTHIDWHVSALYNPHQIYCTGTNNDWQPMHTAMKQQSSSVQHVLLDRGRLNLDLIQYPVCAEARVFASTNLWRPVPQRVLIAQRTFTRQLAVHGERSPLRHGRLLATCAGIETSESVYEGLCCVCYKPGVLGSCENPECGFLMHYTCVPPSGPGGKQ